ncbi:hypothetical protein [Zavarzinia sp. CC-PAN008]|uniref:hypothetical protein n=1 Tax=Zavarzinia sp. CC-PAN008 TaxID=3243332 RepID=UPI003F746E85
MKGLPLKAIATVATALLGACASDGTPLWPQDAGAQSVAATTSEAPASADSYAVAAEPAMASAPDAGTGLAPAPYDPAQAASGQAGYAASTIASTGTAVGARIARMRQDLGALQSDVIAKRADLEQNRAQGVAFSERYHGTVAAINARLQVGTTPGNPVLVEQLRQAQSDLSEIAGSIARLNTLATDSSGDSSRANFLLQEARAAYSLSGALDEDHRQLKLLEDDTQQTVVLIERLMSELTQDINRQTGYVATERANLTTLSLAVETGELLGQSLANYVTPGRDAAGSTEGGSARIDGRRALVIIRFDRPNVAYHQALYTAVSRALERRGDARFDLIAVAPAAGSGAEVALAEAKSRQRADEVLRTLVEMGLPPGRVTVDSATSDEAESSEVRLFVR